MSKSALAIVTFAFLASGIVGVAERQSFHLTNLKPTEDLRQASVCIDPIWRHNTVAKAMVERPDTT